MIHRTIVLSIAIIVIGSSTFGERVTVGGRNFTIPDGFQLDLVTTPSLTERPIVVDFDELGNLYVAESSGTNDNVNKQLEEKPHSILRLSDLDGDGQFDHKTVFAQQMMFPEGAMWHDGSLYVAAPPQIWKLTDTDNDGVADERSVWFDAKTLTGCANDLHGPYIGPDGWIYWCKGAFAEQSYAKASGDTLTTRAAHIFRRRPEGGLVEHVMTGGMDNPVELAFTSSGERIFTTTFFQHPQNGQRDGLVHAIYGGVYGKRHGVIDGHPRTGDLMPVLTHLGAAAPSGLLRLKSDSLGFKNQLVTACFNLHSVTRHELKSHGATFQTNDSVLVESDDLDFHPTDVIEDADGSLLIVDTGGWYKLCCPTSQLHKPDVLGAIYRLSKSTAPLVDDPRGLAIDWKHLSAADAAAKLADSRVAVQTGAMTKLTNLGRESLPCLADVLRDSRSTQAKLNAVWTACRIDEPAARGLVREALIDSDTDVQQAAAHAASAWRDKLAIDNLKQMLFSDSLAVRRVAAEAIGRIGDASAVATLFAAIPNDCGRVLEHSLTYALIEIGAIEPTAARLSDENVRIRRAAMWALHSMPNGDVAKDQLIALLNDVDPSVRQLAAQIAGNHPEWGEAYVRVLRSRIDRDVDEFARLVNTLTNCPEVRRFAIELLKSDSPTPIKIALLDQLNSSDFDMTEWTSVQSTLLSTANADITAAVVRSISQDEGERNPALTEQLLRVAKSESYDNRLRLQAIQCVDKIDDRLLRYAISFTTADHPATLRGFAATAIAKLDLSDAQLLSLADSMRSVAPLEIGRLLDCFESQTNETIGIQLFRSLANSTAANAIPAQRITKLATTFGPQAVVLAEPLLAANNIDPAAQAERLESMLESLPSGDIRRGQQVFHSEKAACFACHAVGYRGGTIGPDLSRIAKTRAKRDLLESIIYPSASFVRSYEPVTISTVDGRQFSGTIRDQNADLIRLQTNATEQHVIRSDDIEETYPSTVSIMPAGLEKQLTNQELADLLAFLQSRK